MPRPTLRVFALAAALGVSAGAFPTPTANADDVVPHGQSRLPGEPLSPRDAARKMTVPPGFSVEIVASEPDLVNPVAMTFDERGRVWVTESLEYPRKPAGPGRDRVKILEDTDGDGKADKFTVFAEGFNIPSGIAVGHGGVWVANSPDILFLRDTDGDGKADTREVVVSGFGRDDTHELPNSLSWGPDGWLYGWNGVFNQSHVKYRGKSYDFTCAVFRIHPKTRDFELFCEGTSNPWGIAWDGEGSAFASACVIDHLWHLTETGYYHRQGGPYPPYTWKIESIVDHKHQQAAYCGIHYYDSDAYPAEYRGKMFMGNIHGNSVNVDELRRDGSSYKGSARPDFLQANDAWFMPVAQKTGPDGSLYVLDWYDRYHCYQDANRDPDGIDRLKGRLYRVRYKDAPRRSGFDLAKTSDAGLVDLLASPNGFDRETARRLIAERENWSAGDRLRSLVLDPKTPRKTRMTALWALVGREHPSTDLLRQLLADPDPGFRAWAVRAAGNARKVDAPARETILALANDRNPDVQLQVAVASRKVEGLEPIALLTRVAAACGEDALIPRIVWQNLHPLLGDGGRKFLSEVDAVPEPTPPAVVEILPRAIERLLGGDAPDVTVVAGLFRRLVATGDREAIGGALDTIAGRFRSRGGNDALNSKLRDALKPVVAGATGKDQDPTLRDDFLIFSAYWGDSQGQAAARSAFAARDRPTEDRLRALDALLLRAGSRDQVLEEVASVLRRKESGPVDFLGGVLAALGSVDGPAVARAVVEAYPALEPQLKPRAVELLTQRDGWALALLKAVADGKIASSALNLNQLRKLARSKNPEVASRFKTQFGKVREDRNPEREQVVGRMREYLGKAPGDPAAGRVVFQRVCAQCHKIYGEGQDVGPEITLNGRGSYEQLLSNVFDPSLVIGSAYQGTTVATADGRVLTGLLVEDSPQRVALKTQGGKLETVPRGDVEEVKVSPLSLMPEDLEKQLSPAELADLFAFITLDKPPGDPKALPIPGAEKLPKK